MFDGYPWRTLPKERVSQILQPPNLKVIRTENLEQIGHQAARLIQGLCSDATVAISGGTTYRDIFKVWRETLGSTFVRLFPVDERIVPFDSQESNWGLIQRNLFQPLDWPKSKRCFLENMNADAAGGYERLLRSIFHGYMPQFDLIFLGVGPDGHTASLFPGGRYLDDHDSWVLQTKSPAPPTDRITIGMGVICAARQVVIIMAGKEKRPVTRQMLAGNESLPIVKVLRHRVKKLLFLDQGAAGD